LVKRRGEREGFRIVPTSSFHEEGGLHSRQVSWLLDHCLSLLPGLAASGSVRQAPQLQWRDRAGFPPDFPIKAKPPQATTINILSRPGMKNKNLYGFKSRAHAPGSIVNFSRDKPSTFRAHFPCFQGEFHRHGKQRFTLPPWICFNPVQGNKNPMKTPSRASWLSWDVVSPMVPIAWWKKEIL